MKANFKLAKNNESENKNIEPTMDKPRKEITEEEFEDFIIKAGAAGSFMVFRSDKKKEDELGLDEL
ncbi:MAG: hypothetical protein ACREBA_00740 [Nitrosotalea sp.]